MLRTKAVPLFLLTVVPLLLQRPAAVHLRLPVWATGGRCQVTESGTTVATIEAADGLTFSCTASRQQVSCDLVGAEPIDVPLAAVCERGSLPLSKADAVIVRSSESLPLAVDWIEQRVQGDLVVLAARQFTAAEEIRIDVAVRSDRLLRFRRAGYSPVTVGASELSGRPHWLLPPAVKGAEMVILPLARRVLPESYDLTMNGASASYSASSSSLHAIRGLLPGAYEVRPGYSAGLFGSVRKITLPDADSTAVAVLDEVGAADLTLDASTCAAAKSVDVTRVEISVATLPNGDRTERIQTTPIVRVPVTRCSLRIGGLSPGEYEFGILNVQDRVVVKQRVRVVADDAAPLLIAAPGNRLSGRVSLNGRPLSSATLEFRPKGNPRIAATGTTDERGRYSTELEQPGLYAITLRVGGLPVGGQQGSVDIAEGDNNFNWDIKGGSLTVKVSNVDQGSRTPVDFSVEQIDPAVVSGRSGFVHSVKASDPDLMKGAYQYPGLGFATYTIRASQARASVNGKTRVSLPVTFTLSEHTPSSTVTLVLIENSGRLILTDPAGGRVRGAKVYGDGLSASEIEAGTYSMEGIPPGHQLQVRAAGFAPTCRTAPDGTTTSVALDSGRAVELEFPGLDPATASPVGVISWFGADCRVALDGFAYSKLPNGPDGTPRFLIANFPATVEVHHSIGWSDQARTFTVLGGRLLVVPLKGR